MVRGHSLPSRARNRETRIHGCERQKHGTDARRIAGEVDYGYHREEQSCYCVTDDLLLHSDPSPTQDVAGSVGVLDDRFHRGPFI